MIPIRTLEMYFSPSILFCFNRVKITSTNVVQRVNIWDNF